MKKKKILKYTGMAISILAVSEVSWMAYCGYAWGWGPFAKLHDMKTARLPGNGDAYDLEQVKPSSDITLSGKTIVFLGSSVTYGAASQGISFADYLERQEGCIAVKEAVSGTTLVAECVDSYIERLNTLAVDKADLFICQLSTNDATQKKPLGKISASTTIEDFDTHTVAGAIEYIIAYAQNTWNCPVLFYTNPKYDSAEYEKMVMLLEKIQEKWGIGIINMWNNETFNNLSDKQSRFYMADSIHPTKAGYLEWWLPYMEKEIKTYYAGNPF